MLGDSSKVASKLTPDEARFAEEVGVEMRRHADALEAAEAIELNRRRAHALASVESRPQFMRLIHLFYRRQTPYPAAVAASLVVAVGLFSLSSLFTQPHSVDTLPNASPLELVLVNDDFDLLEQDLEFYAWVETQL